MTPDDLKTALSKLQGYYPGAWPRERQLVWAEKFLPLDYNSTLRAMKVMAEASEFCSMAAFCQALNPKAEAGVVCRDGAMFLPGTGWIGEKRPAGYPERPELAVVSEDGKAEYVRTQRSKARMGIEAARAVMKSDPEAAARVDRAAAALRLPDETPAEPVEADSADEPVRAQPEREISMRPMAGLVRQAVRPGQPAERSA